MRSVPKAGWMVAAGGLVLLLGLALGGESAGGAGSSALTMRQGVAGDACGPTQRCDAAAGRDPSLAARRVPSSSVARGPSIVGSRGASESRGDHAAPPEHASLRDSASQERAPLLTRAVDLLHPPLAVAVFEVVDVVRDVLHRASEEVRLPLAMAWTEGWAAVWPDAVFPRWYAGDSMAQAPADECLFCFGGAQPGAELDRVLAWLDEAHAALVKRIDAAPDAALGT